MEVHVEDRLTGVGPGVDDAAVALRVSELLRDLRGGEEELARDLRVVGAEVVEGGYVLLGDDEHVRRGLRLDVLEGEDVLVLVDLLRRDLAPDELAEEAVLHGDPREVDATTAVKCQGVASRGLDPC